MASVRQIIKAFRVNPRFLVERKDVSRWRGALKDLSSFPIESIITEGKRILKVVGPGKPRLYYLEAVRRQLINQRHESLKNVQMPQAIKNLFKS